MESDRQQRRAFLQLAAASPLVALVAACAGDEERPAGRGERTGMMEPMPGWMMTPCGMTPAVRADMQVTGSLLTIHQKIRREVTDINAGIDAITTSADRQIAILIQQHVQQMRRRLETGWPIRQMDPLFREIFEHWHSPPLRG
jgi:hypothetical protein